MANDLSTDAVTCTPRAVQEQLKKLKKLAGCNKNGYGSWPLHALLLLALLIIAFRSPSTNGSDSASKPKATPRTKKHTANNADDGGSVSKKPRKSTKAAGKSTMDGAEDKDEAELKIPRPIKTEQVDEGI